VCLLISFAYLLSTLSQLSVPVTASFDATLEDADFGSCYNVYNVALQLADASGVFEEVDPSVMSLLVVLYDPTTDTFGSPRSVRKGAGLWLKGLARLKKILSPKSFTVQSQMQRATVRVSRSSSKAL